MAKYLFFVLMLCIYLPCHGQNNFASWDKKYAPKSYKELIREEEAYSNKVKKEEKTPHDYSRFASYKMRGKFMGKTRPINPKVMQSMKVVFWSWSAALPKPETLTELVQNEYLFNLEGVDVWMPIQKVLEPPLHKEVKIGEPITLYCLFLNDKRLNQPLYNTLMISEFRK